MPEPAEGVGGRHGLKSLPDGVHQGVDSGARTSPYERFELGEHHLYGIEVGAVRREVKQRTIPGLDERADRGPVMGREVVHHDHLSRRECRTEVLADVPLEDVTIDRPWDDQRGYWPREPQATDQGLVQAVIACHLAHGTEVTWGAAVQSGHGGVEATLIQKDQLGRHFQEWCEVIQERRSAFLAPLSGDQRFFYG